jgi:hypothetical protein
MLLVRKLLVTLNSFLVSSCFATQVLQGQWDGASLVEASHFPVGSSWKSSPTFRALAASRARLQLLTPHRSSGQSGQFSGLSERVLGGRWQVASKPPTAALATAGSTNAVIAAASAAAAALSASRGIPIGTAALPPAPAPAPAAPRATVRPAPLRLDDQGREVDEEGNVIQRSAAAVTSLKVTTFCKCVKKSSVGLARRRVPRRARRLGSAKYPIFHVE